MNTLEMSLNEDEILFRSLVEEYTHSEEFQNPTGPGLIIDMAYTNGTVTYGQACTLDRFVQEDYNRITRVMRELGLISFKEG